MKCEKVREWFGSYWDMPEADLRRQTVDEHISHCSCCAAQFEKWKESREWIRESGIDSFPATAHEQQQENQDGANISRQVMARIYEEESWRQPITARIYSLSFKMRRNISLILSFCFALFTISFIHSLLNRPTSAPAVQTWEATGLLPVANAVAGTNNNGVFESMEGVPVASISDPLILTVGHVPADPDYFLIFSILGMAITILILNWFSRIQS